jgi:hypothetical protein
LADSLAIAGIAIAFFAAFFGIRFGIVRGKTTNMQTRCRELVDDAYSKFEAVIYAPKKKDRNPEEALNFAAQYLAWERMIDELNHMYVQNIREEILDIIGLIVSFLFFLFNYSEIIGNTQALVHSAAIAAIGICSFIFFISALYYINKNEKKLGIGRADHRFPFISRILD